MVNQSLKNKKIIISAGASGIGLATAKVCLARGAYVYLCDIDTKSLNKLNKHPLKNKRLFSYACDASDENQVSDLFKKINKKTKKIDALINNVGIAGPTGSLEKLKSEEMNEIFLAQFGGAIELILNAMFNTRPLPVAITGVPRDVSAFAGALGGEKKYLEAAKKYGLNHPSTYKNKAKLSNAVRKFEKQTGIKWPFK